MEKTQCRTTQNSFRLINDRSIKLCNFGKGNGVLIINDYYAKFDGLISYTKIIAEITIIIDKTHPIMSK